MKLHISALFALILATNVSAHGSSHPHWKYHIDINGVEYMSCSKKTVSMAKTVQENRVIFHFFRKNETFIMTYNVTNIVNFSNFQDLITLNRHECSSYFR